ncbi:MAG: tol-pal system YbgF family protein [Phycisphaerae bacterium]
MKLRHALVIAAATFVSLSPFVRADTIRIGGIEYDGKVQRIENGLLYYTVNDRRTDPRLLQEVDFIQIDGQTRFNEAEMAFHEGNFAKAVTGYDNVLRNARDGWQPLYVSRRLLQAADEVGQFDAAARAYATLARLDADAATRMKPKLPAAGSQFLPEAARTLEAAYSRDLPDATRRAILSLLLDVQRQAGDAQAAAQTLDQLVSVGGATAELSTREQASLRLSQASVALTNEQPAEAAKQINDNAALFTESDQQAEALFVLAESKRRLADEGDRPAMLDAALAYMRVVAHFSNDPGRPRVGESLLRTAQIHETLGERDAALKLYRQIAREFAQSPAGAQAKEAIARLEPPTPASNDNAG